MVSRCNTREELVGINSGEDLAEEVRKYHLPDFSNWKNNAAFERAFAPPTFHFGATSRLENDLRTSIGW